MQVSIQQPASGEMVTELVERVRQIVVRRMSGQLAGHGVDHVLRVHRSACAIQDQVGGDRLIVELAALLHDIGDAKFHQGAERSAEFTREILTEFAAPIDVIDRVAAIVDNISYRKGCDRSALSLEGQIVQDADRIDALGAIGIVRTIEYGATIGQPFCDFDDQVSSTGIDHFYDKLFQLRALMNTEPAKRIAEQREQFMRQFLDQFYRETLGPDRCGEGVGSGPNSID